MNSYSAMFMSYLKEGSIPFELDVDKDCERIILNEDVIEIDDSSCRFVRIISSVSKAQIDDSLILANRLNKGYNYIGFCVLPGNPACLCATYYFSLHGTDTEAANQILKMYYIFRESVADAIGK